MALGLTARAAERKQRKPRIIFTQCVLSGYLIRRTYIFCGYFCGFFAGNQMQFEFFWGKNQLVKTYPACKLATAVLYQVLYQVQYPFTLRDTGNVHHTTSDTDAVFIAHPRASESPQQPATNRRHRHSDTTVVNIGGQEFILLTTPAARWARFLPPPLPSSLASSTHLSGIF